MSLKIEGFSEQMNEFENYVNNLESVAGKECKGLVYVIKNDMKKKYVEDRKLYKLFDSKKISGARALLRVHL